MKLRASRAVLCLSLSLAGVASARAQHPPAPDPGPMQKLAFLHGRWEGEGRLMRGPQAPPQVVSVVEQVQTRVGGHVLLLEGRGTIPGRDGGEPVTVHDALGVVTYDAARESFQMRAFRAGQFTDSDVEVGEDRLVWHMEIPEQGRVRYTLTIDEQGRWHELGEMQRGGESWFPFFEMNLTRTADAAAQRP